MTGARVTIRTGPAGSIALARPAEAEALAAHPLLRELSDWTERAAQPILGEAGEIPQVLVTLDDADHHAVRLLGIPLDAEALVERDGLRISGRVSQVELAPGLMVLTIDP